MYCFFIFVCACLKRRFSFNKRQSYLNFKEIKTYLQFRNSISWGQYSRTNFTQNLPSSIRTRNPYPYPYKIFQINPFTLRFRTSFSNNFRILYVSVHHFEILPVLFHYIIRIWVRKVYGVRIPCPYFGVWFQLWSKYYTKPTVLTTSQR